MMSSFVAGLGRLSVGQSSRCVNTLARTATMAAAATGTSASSTSSISAIAASAAATPPNQQQHPHQQQQIRHRSNRSRRGLYNGKDVRSGNNVPFSMKKTKRKFKPNVFKKSVYSETLDEMVRFHLTTSALRSIDKAGGLDNYLLTSRHVTEGEGLAIKERIMQKMATDAKKNEEAAAAARGAEAAMA